jgi:hypothetical protein
MEDYSNPNYKNKMFLDLPQAAGPMASCPSHPPPTAVAAPAGSTKLQMAAPSISSKQGDAPPGAAAATAAGLLPSVATLSSGPPSHASAPPGAPSATNSLAPTPSFKEVASRQGILSGLHAAAPEVTSHQGRPSGLHAAVPEAPTVSIQMPMEALTHACPLQQAHSSLQV